MSRMNLNALQQKFATAREELSAALIERDDEIDLLMTALVAGENPLLIGPPGVAKSMLVDSLMAWTQARGFSVLFTKTLGPEDVFGPLDIDAFVKEKRWERCTKGWLPEAEIAFGDETFKASGVILNNLLKILNEGQFQNNGVWNQVPLLMFVGASNEWPSAETGQELSALLDRFLFRKTVKPVSTRAGEERLYDFDGVRSGPKFSARITPAEVLKARDDAKALPYTGAAKEAFIEIVRKLASEGIRPGDRRRYKAVGAARAYAYLCGASEVEPVHLECLANVLWDDPREHPAKAAEVVLSIANPDGRTVSTLLDETEEIVRGYNRSDLTSYASADSKLQEIVKKLKAVGSNPRAVKAVGYVKEEIKRIRLATVAAGV